MDFKEILVARRAINFFDPNRDVDPELLKTVIEDAANAPSGYNLQPWRLIVLRDPAAKAKLRPLAFNQPKVTEAPVILMILADREGWKPGNPTFEAVFEKTMQPEQRDWFVNATQGLYGKSADATQAFAVKNASLFAMSIMYAAANHGLQTHPMDGFNHDAVREAFDIPETYWVPMLMAVGYMKPGLEIRPKAWRMSYEEMVLKTY